MSGFCTQRGLDCQALGKVHRCPSLEAEGRALRQQDELDEWPLLQFRPREDSILSPHGHWMPCLLPKPQLRERSAPSTRRARRGERPRVRATFLDRARHPQRPWFPPVSWGHGEEMDEPTPGSPAAESGEPMGEVAQSSELHRGKAMRGGVQN